MDMSNPHRYIPVPSHRDLRFKRQSEHERVEGQFPDAVQLQNAKFWAPPNNSLPGRLTPHLQSSQITSGIGGYTNINQGMQVGVEIEPMLPVLEGGVFNRFLGGDFLPPGLMLDEATGEIFGTPEEPAEEEDGFIVVTPVAFDGSFGDPFTIRLEIGSSFRNVADTLTAHLGLATVVLLYFVVSLLPLLFRSIWPPLSPDCGAQLSQVRAALSTGEPEGSLANALPVCDLMPHSKIELITALALIVFTKVCFADLSFGKGHRRRKCFGAYEWIAVAINSLNWFLVALWCLFDHDATGLFKTAFQVRVLAKSGDFVLTAPDVNEVVGASCIRFKSFQQIEEAVGLLFSRASVWAFMMGTLMMCLGETMKLTYGQPFLLRWCVNIRPLMYHSSNLPASKIVKAIATGIARMSLKFERCEDQYEEPLDLVHKMMAGEAAAVTHHMESVLNSVFHGDVRRVLWPLVLQAFGFALWAAAFRAQQSASDNCLSSKTGVEQGRPVFGWMLSTFGIHGDGRALWMLQAVGLVLGLTLLLVVFCVRPLLWYWDPGRGFAQWLLPVCIFPALAFYAISLEEAWSNLPAQGSSSGLCMLSIEDLPSNRTTASWARKLLLSIYLIELAVRLSLWVQPFRARYIASFAAGFAAGFAVGWQLAWDTCSLVWLTTSLSWAMGVAACILVCLGIEPSQLEEVAVQKAVLDVAEARQKAHYSRRHLLPLSGMCLGMFLCSTFVMLAAIIAWACDFEHPAMQRHMHQSTFSPAVTTMAVPANKMTTTAAFTLHSVQFTTAAATPAMHSVQSIGSQIQHLHSSHAHFPFVDLRLQNETCSGSIVNRQLGLEDRYAETKELCQQLCIASRVCKFVQFESAHGRCHLYEDCGKLRNCGQPCGRTFKLQT
mmetsp:Transcript_70973/g.140914  ORF Transcript_70973/g.140914 Transcript_70973/m.140914 type:complete len:888 (+) Transcript_70973:85-2748(+)